MKDSRWMIYGATGFTGRLVAEVAVRRGCRPVLGGRSADKLRPLAEAHGLDYVVCDLENAGRLAETVAGFDLVCHLAGPYIYTSEPMVRACLDGRTNYLDVTGEISVVEAIEAHGQEAEEKGVALIPAAGFVATTTDCCARYAADQLSVAIRLDLAVASPAEVSPGTAKSILEMLPDGVAVRKNGELIHQPLGRGDRRITFLEEERRAIPAPQADLVTAYISTGIPDITTYVAVPFGITPLAKAFGPLVQRLLAAPAVRNVLRALIERFVHGPDADSRRTERAYIWARAEDEHGGEAEVWLETTGSYPFTAHAVVRAAERILAEHPTGFLTPSQAFGPDFVLEIPGTVRRESLR